MKIIVSQTKMNFVDLTTEQVEHVKKISGEAVVKEAVNGITVKGSTGTMYNIICELSFKYDIEIV